MGILDTLSKAADQILNSNTVLLEKTGIKKPKAGSSSSSRTSTSGGSSSSGSTSTRTASQTYTVKRGDTLSGIAKKFYGKASLYPEIFDANRGILDDPDKIRVGQKLRIPDLV